MNVKELAKNYKEVQTKNVCDLEEFDITLDIETRDFTTQEGEPFSVDVVTIEDEEYRVPKSVVKQIKNILESKPDLQKVKVTKSGEGIKTEYQVIPL